MPAKPRTKAPPKAPPTKPAPATPAEAPADAGVVTSSPDVPDAAVPPTPPRRLSAFGFIPHPATAQEG